MAGSQLNQLKGQLRDAGVVRTSTGKGSGGRKRKGKQQRRPGGGADPEARRRKIDEITASHNLFDLKLVKPKFPVAGQRRPNDLPTSELRRSGAPAQSRSRGERLRRETLLPEYHSRHRNSSFVDRRFGEGDAGVSAEEKALQRFVAERRARFDDEGEASVGGGGRKGKRKVFNLDADDDEGLFDQDEGLTHGGMALDLDGEDGEDDDTLGGFNVRPARNLDDGEGERDEGRKRSKAEVMSEVIAKSKMHKQERQQRRDDDDDVRIELDEELKSIRTLLGGGGVADGKARPGSASEDGGSLDDDEQAEGSEAVGGPQNDEEGNDETRPDTGVDRALLAKLIGSASPEPAADSDDDDTVEGDDYDQFVRELAFEKRAKPTDRLKTATERAAEEADRLRRLEEGRIKRMRGEVVDDDDDDEGDGGKRGSKKRKGAAPQADDLDDDFVEDDEGEFRLGQGLRPDGASAGILQDDVDPLLDDDEGSEGESDDEGSEEEDIDLGELEGSSEEGEDAGPTQSLVEGPVKPAKPRRDAGRFELAYTYPCPSSHAELLSILASAGAGPSDVATVVDRIRVLHHPSLSPDNNAKLAVLGGVLLDHIIHLSSTSASFDAINSLIPHLASLVTSFAQELAAHFVSKLVLMQRNLVRGLVSQATRDPSAKTFPGVAELAVLRLVGALWSSSDFSHPVCAPAVLLVEQYLGQARVRHLADLTSGVFLCTVVLQYEAMSKRLVPEAVNFLANALALLLPDGLEAAKGADWPLQEVAREGRAKSFSVPAAASRTPRPLALRPLLALDSAPVGVDDQGDEKVDLLDAVLSLVANFAALYASLDGFTELFSPLHRLLSRPGEVPRTLVDRLASTRDGLDKRLRFARQARRPLTLQRHRAIPIPSLAPAFDDGDPTKRRWYPDSDRAEAAKLRSLLKKEKKGAVRELRKDNRFLAAEKAKEKAEEEKAYKAKIGRITAGLNEERVEEKKLKLQKMRSDRADRKRSGGGGPSSKR